MIGAYIRELAEIVKTTKYKEEGKKLIYGILPAVQIAYTGYKYAGGDNVYVSFPDLLLVDILNGFFHKAAHWLNYAEDLGFTYGLSLIHIWHSANYLMSGWAYVAYERMTLHAIGSYNGQIAYCIEPGVDQDSGDTLTSTDESYWDNYPASSNVTIPPETIKTLLGRVLTYCYHGNISQD